LLRGHRLQAGKRQPQLADEFRLAGDTLGELRGEGIAKNFVARLRHAKAELRAGLAEIGKPNRHAKLARGKPLALQLRKKFF